jgi:hypothetical protein
VTLHEEGKKVNDIDFEKYLGDRYEVEIKYYEDRAARYKTFYNLFQWAVIILSAGVPPLAAIIPEQGKAVTIVVSVILAIGTTALKTFKLQENWLGFRAVAETLKKEKHFFAAGLEGYNDLETKQSLFVERVESLISREHSIWIGSHRQNSTQRNGD